MTKLLLNEVLNEIEFGNKRDYKINHKVSRTPGKRLKHQPSFLHIPRIETPCRVKKKKSNLSLLLSSRTKTYSAELESFNEIVTPPKTPNDSTHGWSTLQLNREAEESSGISCNKKITYKSFHNSKLGSLPNFLTEVEHPQWKKATNKQKASEVLADGKFIVGEPNRSQLQKKKLMNIRQLRT